MRTAPPTTDMESVDQEVYTLKGYSSHMRSRTAQTQARFFLPHLRPNISLLDCGCGPGSITCGLAAVVAPGETVGIDINPDDIERAQSLAAEQKLPNARFEAADVYELPFPSDSFDAVFSHALLEHLHDPLKALKEMRRVLKPGGVAGIRTADQEGNLFAPHDPQVLQFERLYRQLSAHNGGNPTIGRTLPALMRKAGFVRIEISASYSIVTGAPSFRDLPMVKQMIDLGWTDREQADSMSDAYQKWMRHPDNLNARAFCEAIASKD